MMTLRRMASNVVVSMIGQVITWTSTLLLLICYGRFLGDVKVGELYTAIAFVLLIGFPIDVSFTQQIVRDIAQAPEKAPRYLSNTILIKATLWLVLYGLMLLLSWLLKYNIEVRILIGICGFVFLCSAISNSFASLHYAFQRAIYPVTGTILEKGLSAIIGYLILKNGAGVQVMALVLLAGALINATWQGVWFLRRVGIHFVVDLELIRKLVSKSFPFLITGILGVIYYRIDTILLSLMTSLAVVGWYGAGYRLFDTLIFLSSMTMTITYPILVKLYSKSDAELKMGIEKTMNLLLFCGIPISVALIVAAPNIIGFLYHRPEFINTIPVLQGLAPGLVFLYMNALLANTLVTIKRENRAPYIMLTALVFNLGLNFILIPRYQHIGAAIDTSLTEMLIFSMQAMFIPRYFLPLRSVRVGTKAILASIVMAVAIWYMRKFSIFLILPVAMLTYLGVATLLGTIPRKDLQTLYRAILHKTQPELPIIQQKVELETSSK